MSETPARCLTKRQAADYCGLTLRGFAGWVREGIVPPAIHKTTRWDKKAIDIALDQRSNIPVQSEDTALEDWLRGQKDAGNA